MAAATVPRGGGGDALAGILPGGGRPGTDHLPFTAGGKQALEISLRQALDLGDRRITTLHVLLGVLKPPESTAGRVLDALSVTPDAVRQQALSRSGSTEPIDDPLDGDPPG